MRITRLETIRLGRHPHSLWLRIHTDDGLIGLGETSYAPRAVSALIHDQLAPLLLGQSPLDIERHWHTMFAAVNSFGYGGAETRAISAVDIALWDILGKDAGMPCHALMGGAARREIPLYWSVGSGWIKTPDQMLDDVTDGWDAGYKSFKIRMDWKSYRQDTNPAKDLAMFKLVRDFLPNNIYLGFDANNGYSVSTAIQQGRAFEDYGRIDHFEEPLPQYDLPGLRQVSDALDVAISTGEQDWDRWRFRDVIMLGNPDILQPDILGASGPSEILKIYTLATTHNKPVMPHSPSAGINSIASLHCYSTIKNAIRPHEFSIEFAPPLEEIAELYGEHVIPKDGVITLTNKPGLGIDISEATLAKFAA
jgi:D-galactarolactone cycloisomerase